MSLNGNRYLVSLNGNSYLMSLNGNSYLVSLNGNNYGKEDAGCHSYMKNTL